ncbi:MAG: hypothetical protein K5739_09625 [Lachnospiraceae bacterium]|nr:hypothetical protein [Lachnospiraceae bacterium]
MTTAMTERDKKLLYMLGFIVIIFLFIIIADRPLFRKIRATNKEIAQAQEIHDEMEMKISRMAMVEAYKQQIEERVSRYTERYYPMMDSTAIDDLLTGYVLDRGLKAVDLYIDMPKEAMILPPYQYSEAWQMIAGAAVDGTVSTSPDQAKVDAFTSNLNSGEDVDIEGSADAVTDTALSGVYGANVSLTAYGKEEDLKNLLDQLCENRSIRVTQYNWGDIPGTGFSYVDGQIVELKETDRQLTVSLQFMMYDENAYVQMQLPEEEEQ